MSRTVDRKDTLTWRRCRGFNSWDAAEDLDDDIAAAAVNVQYEASGLVIKRRGSEAVTITGEPHTGYNYLANFVPAGGDPLAQLFIITADAPTKVLIVRTGTTALAVLLVDPFLGGQVHTAQLNNKLFVAYHSAINRLHVLEADSVPPVLRRTGMARPSSLLTVTNTGAGTYPNTLRYYREQWQVRSASGLLERGGNLGPSVAFTPSGTGAAARIQTTGPSGENETHWAIYVSADNATFYFLATLPVATLTYDDTSIVGSWLTDVAPLEGANTNWPAVKFLCSTGDRLLGFGAWRAGDLAGAGDAALPFAGRVYFSPVINTSDLADEERISDTVQVKGWIDIARNAGADDRGIIGSLDNQILVAQARGLWLLVPTGQDTRPFRRVVLSVSLGWVSQWSAFAGEDDAGRPAIYFLDPRRGPYRLGARGLEWLGYDLQAVWATVDANAPTSSAHGMYIPGTRECRWWVRTIDDADLTSLPNTCLNFNVREGQVTATGDVRGGWSVFTGPVYAHPTTSVMFSRTLTSPRSAFVSPYLGTHPVVSGALLRADVTGLSADLGVPYYASVISKAWKAQPTQNWKQLIRAWLRARAGVNVQIEVGTLRNYGDEYRASVVSLTPPAVQTRVQVRVDAASVQDATVMQIALGDPGWRAAIGPAPDRGWTLDEFLATIEYGAET